MKTKPANWSAPPSIRALSTTSESGFSQGPFAANNLALHVDDNPQHVQQNRAQLRHSLHLTQEPLWLNQTHSTECIVAEEDSNRDADAAVTRTKNLPLAILTADCLPIMLCSIKADEIAAIHAGWKGLANGIIENTLSKMHSQAADLMAWIGPSICQNCYEVGAEVFQTFTTQYPQTVKAFRAREDKWLANLPLIAEIVMQEQGVKAVYQSELCTFELKNEMYSYRRQANTGRIATLIWIND